jgi:circadian clock protein KaiB
MVKSHSSISRRTQAQFERALQSVSTEKIQLRLYVAGLTPNSMRAVLDLRRLCEEHLPGRCEVEIVDIYQQPERAVEAQIVAVPTLLKTAPAPQLRLIGSLTESKKVLKNLGLAA